MNVCFDGVGTLTSLLKVLLVVSDYIFITSHVSLSIIIWPVFSGLGDYWGPIIWTDYSITIKIIGAIWNDYMASM